MSTTATAAEVYMVELVNAERAKVGVAPLAIDDTLGLAADRHSDWMLATDTFSHTGVNGSTPGDRMKDAGYDFTGRWTWGENVAWASSRGAPGVVEEVDTNHAGLMESDGHRANILNPAFREIGLGVRTGEYDGWDAAMITQVFARSGDDLFVTGVATRDADADGAYDIGEGRGGIEVVAVRDGTIVSRDVTGEAGDYALALRAGTYTVTFDGGDARTVTVADVNVKLDHDVADATTTDDSTTDAPATDEPMTDAPDAPPAPGTISGGASADVLRGTGDAETIEGRAGNDRLLGLGGDDVLEGGAGDDALIGGAGADTLVGGAGIDTARYDGATRVRADLANEATNAGAARGDTYDGVENLVGSRAGDALLGDGGANTIWAGAGADWLVGRDGADVLVGGAGNDVLVGGAGADVLAGGAGRDTVVLTGAATLDLWRGDLSSGEAAGDRHISIERALGSAGRDTIRGTARNDVLEGRGGQDVLVGRGGADVLAGGDGNDALYGGAGNDLLIGGAGTDVLAGGAGRDVFRFHDAAHSAAGAGDVVRDFERGEDRLHLGFIDADVDAAGDQAFAFVDAFTGAGGEARAVAGAVLVDLDGDSAPDMVVRIGGGVTLDEGDLVL